MAKDGEWEIQENEKILGKDGEGKILTITKVNTNQRDVENTIKITSKRKDKMMIP